MTAIKTVKIGLVKPNPITEKLYGKFDKETDLEDYKLFKSVERNGIKIPLKVTSDFYIIKGNRRLRAAQCFANITKVKVIVEDILFEDLDDLTIMEYQIQRVKDEIAVAWEYERMTEIYGIKSGKKNVQDEVEKRDELLKKDGVSEKTIRRVLESKALCMELYRCSKDKAWEYLRKFRREDNIKIDGIRKRLIRDLAEKKNKEVLPKLKVYNDDWFKIYHRKNTDLRDIIKDGEIDCSLSSPPYWDYRFYEEDEKESPITKSKKSSKSQKDKVEKQLGQEATPEEYIENLMKSYKECIRTLKDTGSIWVNIMDTRRDGEIMEIPSELIRAFKKEGMKCVERCVWFKVNPPFNDSKTYQSSEEYVIHFVKDTKKYKWFNSWFGSEDEFLGKMTYGDKDKNRRFKNIFVYPNPKEDGVGVASGLIETNVINNSYLVKLMRNNGMELLHNALYSTEIPMICILSTTEKGDSVLDNFNGLGTSGLVAYAHECKYYGIEISEQYAKQTGIRLKDFLENNPHLKRTSEKAKTPKKTTKTKG